MSDARPARARTPADTSQRLDIADLLKELVTDIGDPFRTELRLAKSELQDSIGSFRIGLIAIGAGAVILPCALLRPTGAALAFLAPAPGVGWAALAVAALTCGIAIALFVFGGKRLSGSSLVPNRALTSIKRDVEVLEGDR